LACLTSGKKRREWATMSFTPLRSAASIIRSHSATVVAMGFSTSTCLPWSAAHTVCLAWTPCGHTTATMSMSSAAHKLSTDASRRMPNFSA